MVLSMNPSAHTAVGLYYLSGLSVVILSKKEGWFACASTVLLLASCVVRAMLGVPAETNCEEEMKKPKMTRRVRSMRADAEPYQRRVSPVQHVHVQNYRNLLTALAEQQESKPASEEPAFKPPPGLPAPLTPADQLRATWRACEEAAADTSDARALLAKMVEIEGGPILSANLRRTRKPMGKRLVAGVRETVRAVATGRAVAVMVASDLEWVNGKLGEPKMQSVVDMAIDKGVPVVVGLSRAELGATISRDVAAAVVAVIDVTGAEDEFARLVQASCAQTPTPAPAA